VSSGSRAFLLDALRGFYTAWRGFLLLKNQRLLWKWAALPAVVNFVVFIIVFALFLQIFDDLYAMATSFLVVAPPTTWYAWLWVAPVRLLAWAIGLLMLVVSVVVIYLTFLVLGTTIASPFLAMLAQAVEELVGNPAVAPTHTTMRDQWHALAGTLLDELRKLAFFIGIQLGLVLLGLIPFLTPVTIVASALFTMFFLPLEYAGFAMDRRQLRFAQRRDLLWQHRWSMLGFGAAASLTFFIPLLNFFCLPILVVGGTLLILDIEATQQRSVS
jgi:CysZ protein